MNRLWPTIGVGPFVVHAHWGARQGWMIFGYRATNGGCNLIAIASETAETTAMAVAQDNNWAVMEL